MRSALLAIVVSLCIVFTFWAVCLIDLKAARERNKIEPIRLTIQHANYVSIIYDKEKVLWDISGVTE